MQFTFTDKIIKLAVVDDSLFFRAGLVSLIQSQKNLNVIIESSNGKELIDTLAIRSEMPDIVIMDLEMPVMNGFKTIDYLLKYYPEIRILVLTGHNDARFLHHLIDKGVNGFLVKDTKKIDKVTEALNVIYMFKYYYAELDMKKIMSTKNPILQGEEIVFTKRQLQIVELVCQQYTDKEISKKLFISERTVHGHKTVIFKKTSTHSTLGLAMYAVKNNLISM